MNNENLSDKLTKDNFEWRVIIKNKEYPHMECPYIRIEFPDSDFDREIYCKKQEPIMIICEINNCPLKIKKYNQKGEYYNE